MNFNIKYSQIKIYNLQEVSVTNYILYTNNNYIQKSLLTKFYFYLISVVNK